MHREHLEICSVPETQREAQLQRWDVGPIPKRPDSPAQSAKKSSILAGARTPVAPCHAHSG